MHTDVDLVKGRTNIVDIVGEYVRLLKAGQNYKARCPFHQEKTPSFTVNEEKQIFHCFGCGKGGDVLTFVMEIESLAFREALKLLAERAGIELTAPSPEAQKAKEAKDSLAEIITLSERFFAKQFWETPAGAKAKTYLAERGISEDSMRQFGLGYAPDGWHHTEQFLAQHFDKQQIAQAGMIIQKDNQAEYYDRFRHRLMFPIHDALGRPVGFTARVMPGADDKSAKYINTPESPLYHKGSTLYGLHHAKQAIKTENHVVVVEGNMDVIAAHQAGYKQTVAVSGTALTPEHICILLRYTRNFVLFFDADDAGQLAARRSVVASLAEEAQVKLVFLEDGKDAAELLQEAPALLKSAIDGAVEAVAFYTARAGEAIDPADPQTKKAAVEDVAELLAAIPDNIVRDEWVKNTAYQYGVTAEDMHARVAHFQQTPQQSPEAVAESAPPEAARQERVRGHVAAETLAVFAQQFKDLWERIAQEAFFANSSRYSTALALLYEHGKSTQYNIDQFLQAHPEQQEWYATALEALQMRYGEMSEEEQRGYAQRSYDEMIRILQQDARTEIMQQIAAAEHAGDDTAVTALTQKLGTLITS